MAGVVWTKTLKRSMLEYINENLTDNGSKNFDGVRQHLELQFAQSDLVIPSSKEIKRELLNIISKATIKVSGSNGEKHRTLWRKGPGILEFDQPILKGIFSKIEITAFRSTSVPASSRNVPVDIQHDLQVSERSIRRDKRRKLLAEEDDAPVSTSNSSVAETAEEPESQTESPLHTPHIASDDKESDADASASASAASGPKKRLKITLSTQSKENVLNIDTEGVLSEDAGNPTIFVRTLTLDIENAVDVHLKRLGIESDRPVIITERDWGSGFEELKQAVFGNRHQPEKLASLLMSLAAQQPLSFSLLLRSLIVAGVCKWAMLPDPTGIDWDVDEQEERSENKTLDALLSVLIKEATELQRRKLRHLVHQQMADNLLDTGAADSNSNELHDRATFLGEKLYLALSSIFVSRVQPPYVPSNEGQYLPLRQDDHSKRRYKKQVDSFPAIRSFDLPMNGFSPSEVPRFQRDLTNIFKMALKFRTEMIKSSDSLYEFDFPHFEMAYERRAHTDDTLAAVGKAHDDGARHEDHKKIYIATMFGIRQMARERYSEDYGQERILTRAIVHLIQEQNTTTAT